MNARNQCFSVQPMKPVGCDFIDEFSSALDGMLAKVQ
jgi:hypothetical protein